MSRPHFPQEITDYIIDLLKNERGTLEQCCLVSKSWVPRTRRYLFSAIRFPSSGAFEVWMRTFPDPSNSPAHYVQYLQISCMENDSLEIITGSEWIPSFSNVVRLAITSHYFIPSPSQILRIVCSLPLLEDLEIISRGTAYTDPSVIFQPSISPPLTGKISIFLMQGMEHMMRALLGLPNGVHFQKVLCTTQLEEDFRWITALVEACSDTLEFIEIRYLPHRPRRSLGASIPLSGATKIKEMVFRPSAHNVEWATTGLKTITSEHKDLRLVLLIVSFPSIADEAFGEGVYTQWVDLDRTLVRLQKSSPVHTKLHYITTKEPGASKRVCELIGNLLPESTKAGVVELADSVG